MRTRNNSQPDRRRSERDAELRRRRHHRQMSQASERLQRMAQQFDLEFPVLQRSTSSASSSSVPTIADTHLDNLSSSSQSQLQPQNGHSEWFTNSAFSSDANANTSSRLRAQARYDDSPFIPAFRSRSDDGQHACEPTNDLYTRSLVRIQEQLDSMRELLNGNLSSDDRNAPLSDPESLNLERAALEEDFHDIMMECVESSGPSFTDVAWARRRAAVSNGEARSRRLNPALKSVPNFADTGKDVDRIRNSAAFRYSFDRTPTGSDVWPDIRDPSKVPARFAPVSLQNSWRHVIQTNSFAGKGPCFEWGDYDDYSDDVSTKLVWPMNVLPSELYYLIADSLSRDDIKAMRLTCKEFEHHISCILFKTVVVPFNIEIYGMLQGVPQIKTNMKFNGKGKGKATTSNSADFWKTSKDEDIYTGYGVDVFRSFGPRMKRFGMSFEVDEEMLANPPLKGMREDHKSYWGVYQWPYPEYRRFDQVAGLEDAADETPRMKTAFSFLTEVQELALSLDAGLGWLAGPDRSIRSRVLGDRRPVFGNTDSMTDRKQEARQWLWQYLKAWTVRNGNVDLRHCTVAATKIPDSMAQYSNHLRNLAAIEEPVMPFIDLRGIIDPTAEGLCIAPDSSEMPRLGSSLLDHFATAEDERSGSNPSKHYDSIARSLETGVFCVQEDNIDLDRLERYPIVPSDLSKLQKEWLLETEWAQRAFLSSWLIAVVDNRYTFQHVHTLNFSRISSRFLLSLCREDFWRALPQLQNVTIEVIPDCREVIKDNAGFVETPRVLPIAAVWLLHKLLVEMIALRSTIKSLTAGWASGGEFAQGLTARNKHLMPAPILPPEWLASAENMADKGLLETQMLKFPHVKNLTLKNCWISPHGLMHLVQEHPELEMLCLESVSLTAEMVHNQGPNAGQLMAMAQHLQGPLMPQHNVPNQGAAMGTLTNQQAPHHALLQAVQNVNNLAVATGLHQAQTTQAINTSSDWLAPRVGSWPHVLDAISPGITLEASGSIMSPINIPASNMSHALHVLNLQSCGYCRLNNSRLDESAVPPPTFGGGSGWFQRRFTALSKVMMVAKGYITAEIVQSLPQNEEQALTMGFELTLGWPSEWADEAEAPVYDACLRGGTGRFHGTILRESRRKGFEE